MTSTKNTSRRILSMLLAVALVLSLLPGFALPAYAESESGSAPTFDVDGKSFTDLNEANAYAVENSVDTITLTEDGTLPAGTYTISKGVTLLIPFDDAHTLYTTTPTVNAASPSGQTAYSTLTMADGATLTVNGALSVSAQLAAGGSNSANNGGTTGAYGYIVMNAGSHISIENGAALYAWGYISGNGSVEAKSGATVYEPFQIMDFRGGSATLNWYGGILAAMSKKPSYGYLAFAFSQYYIQNIEVPLTIQYGATEYAYASLQMDSSVQSLNVKLIGTSDSMFNLLEEGSSLTKIYDSATDRLIIDISGNAQLSSISLNVTVKKGIISFTMPVSSDGYILPINSNMTLNILSGTTTLTQDVALQAGVQASIAEGATLEIASGKKLFVYDSDEWLDGGYVYGSNDFIRLNYSPTRSYTRTKADLTDVVVDVNGTISCSGSLYTTEGGASIISSCKTGKIDFVSAAGTDTATEQMTQSSSTLTKVTVPITSAKLLNGDGTYTETDSAAAGNAYVYKNGKWIKDGDPYDVTVTFDANGGTGTMDAQTISGDTATALATNGFSRTGYTFTGWNTAEDGSGTNYANGASVMLDEDTTLYAQWKINTYTVTWVNDDGSTLKTDTDVPYGSVPSYNGSTPTKAADAQYTYTFDGWTPTVSAVTGDVTYKATYTTATNTYTITWMNGNTVFATTEVEYGAVPSYPTGTPTKASDAGHTYAFSSWKDAAGNAPAAVTSAATYYAQYTESINTYTVTWQNYDGTKLYEVADVEYGSAVPAYKGNTPTRTADAQYTYTFSGWSPAVNAITANTVFTATYTTTLNTYTVTWMNGNEKLGTSEVAYGDTPVYSGTTPAKTDASGHYTYTFAGWTPEITKVTGNATYTAKFTETENTFTVTWLDFDGSTVLEKDEGVAWGSKPSYDGTTPTKAEDAQYTYEFKDWTPEITDDTTVTADMSYTAVYEGTLRTYTVKWQDADGTVLETDKDVSYGTSPSYDGTTPTKASDYDYNYSFSRWVDADGNEPATVTGNMTYTATYNKTAIVRHTVTFNANGGEGSMDTQTFVQGVGTNLTANAFTRENYKFVGWNTKKDGAGTSYADKGAIISLEADITLYAQWKFDAPAADYDTFVASLKVLEGYASDYVLLHSDEDAVALVLNFIRTGTEKYTSDSWTMLAGAENTGFSSYVAEQDSDNGTTAQAVRGVSAFVAPDGTLVEFAHMFATMDLAYNNGKATATLDYGGWAGDLVDLLEYTNGKLTATETEEMISEILSGYLATEEDTEGSYDIYDFRGDMDAYYLITKMSDGDTISSLMKGHFTSSLTDADRASYFATNRFSGSTTQNALREAVYAAYTENSAVSLLESDRSLTNLSDLRTACCYAFADYLWQLAEEDISAGKAENTYYSVFSSEDSTLAPGVTQNISYAMTADNKQIVFYTATIDISRHDVNIYANYKDNDASSWGMATVTDQMAAAKEKHSDSSSEDYIENYTPVVGVNADFYNMTTGAPSGALVMEGVEYHGVGSENFFAILKDGTAIIGGSSEYETYKEQIQEAIGGGVYLVKNGKIAVTANSDYYNNRASRTCVGITADGKVVLMVLDGRQEPFSVGGSAEEIAQIMLETGCVTAINLDGGGSSTYAAKEEGSDEVTVVNSPSDGYERSVSSSLMVVSTAQSSDTFDHALVSSDTDYLTVGANLNVSAIGVSITGGSAVLPEGTELVVSDESVATLSNGVLTGVAEGDVTVSVVADGKTYGSKKLHVVTPDGLTFTKDKMNAVYGSSVALPLEATYNSNPVTICADDVALSLSTSTAGTFEGLSFIGDESSGVRVVTVTAQLTENLSVSDTIEIALYKNGEAVFDFDAATSGDEQLAWNREVSNSTTDDKVYYRVSDPTKEMDISYVFALDMSTVPIPKNLAPILDLVAGGDVESVRAWDLLLQLAERVGEKTTVTFTLELDENLDIDYSGVTLVNDYFTLTSTSFDEETHTLTIVCCWNKQTKAIDEDTANPIVILSGIKATPKDGAAWDENECLTITNSGSLSYDIYLRSSTLYSTLTGTDGATWQETYGVYPYEDAEHLYEGATQKGGHFATTYKTFEDSFTLDKSSWNGWKQSGDDLYYYVDNVALTGIQCVPGYEDEENSYYYDFGDDGVCAGMYTGFYGNDEDGWQYIVAGKLSKASWIYINAEDQWYYFAEDGYAATGTVQIEGLDYKFEGNNGKCVGAWCVTDEGKRFYFCRTYYKNTWVEIEGEKYYFDNDGYCYTGTCAVSHLGNYLGAWEFDADGKFVGNITGVFQDARDGLYHYAENGVLYNGGLLLWEGDYYYAKANYSLATTTWFVPASATNGLKDEGTYEFGSDAKMIIVEPEVKNGICDDDYGVLSYYIDGVQQFGSGVIEIDGSYYYVRTNGNVVHGTSWFIPASATNGLVDEGTYQFNDDGTMIIVEPVVKNGVCEDDYGVLSYYIDGVQQFGSGVIEIDGSYYYVRTNGNVVNGKSWFIPASATNGLVDEGTYEFDTDGKMILETD